MARLLRWTIGAVAAAAMAVAGPACMVEPALADSVVVVHGHAHGPHCGHYRVWYSGAWVYYVGGHWAYWSPVSHSYVVYSHVPPGLAKHHKHAKAYRGHAKAVRSYHKGGPGPMVKKAPGYGKHSAKKSKKW